MNIYEQILEQMREYSDLFDTLIDFEQKKFEAVKENNLDVIDEFLKTEQVYLLKVRGLDGKREEILKKSGFEGYTFRQLINDAEGGVRDELEILFGELEKKTENFKKLMDSLNSFVDMKLFSVEEALERIREFEGKSEGTMYEKDAKNQVKVPQARFKSTKA